MPYEYKVENLGNPSEMQFTKTLNSYGQEGWKVVGMSERSDGNGDSSGFTVILMRECDSISTLR